MFGLPEQELLAKGHNACSGCGENLGIRLALKAATKDTILVQNTSCGEVTTVAYPRTSYRIPYIHCLFENGAAVASGIETALKKLNKKTKVLIFAGDGGTFDIGFQALSGAVERGHDFCYVCFDTAAYSNTGIQRSGATPKYADTTTSPVGNKILGKMEWKKPMPLILAAHNMPYVATASVAFPIDLYKKVKKGLEMKGPAYVQVFSPCVPGWKFPTSQTVNVARKAVETCINPLYEIENGNYKLNYKPAKKINVEEYLKLQGRFKHLFKTRNKLLIKEIQKHVDNEWVKLLKLC
tara:strand:- start:364 stop:1248 length:885 start_codon:yes stop_codon:yes gene_type:complete